MSALQNKQKTRKNILPFVTEYRPSVSNLKTMLMSKSASAKRDLQRPSPTIVQKREILERRTRKSKALKVMGQPVFSLQRGTWKARQIFAQGSVYDVTSRSAGEILWKINLYC